MAQPSNTMPGAPRWAVRPIAPDDAPALCAWYGGVDLDAAQTLIAASQQAFAGLAPRGASHLFVLERQRLCAVAALVDHLGMQRPRYCFRTGTVVHASAQLAMFNPVQTLALGNDLTGATELVLPKQAWSQPQDGLATLLSALLWYVADLAQRFDPALICELPGIGERSAQAPFWHALGRHFYSGSLPGDHALWPDPSRSAIGRLLPKHTLYSALLGAAAQASIGQAGASAHALEQQLMQQGFRWRHHVSMFDGGPILEATLADTRAAASSRLLPVRVAAVLEPGLARQCWLRKARQPDAIVLATHASVVDEGVLVSATDALTLGVDAGDLLRVACHQ